MKRALLLMTLLVACAGEDKPDHEQPGDTKETHRQAAPARKVEVIAHRGSSARAPENTLAAFRLAIEEGADWFELDCTLSKDGHVVVIHDDTLERTTDGSGRVDATSLKELAKLDAGTWKDAKYAGEPIPTLADSLALAKGKIGVYVEIKSRAEDRELRADILEVAEGYERADKKLAYTILQMIESSRTPNLELTDKTLKIIREQELEGRVVVQSFSPIVCAIAKLRDRELQVELLAFQHPKKPEVWREYQRWLELLEFVGFNPGNKGLTREQVTAFKQAGRRMAVWTVNEPADWRRLAEWGVNRLITDKPAECLKELEALGLR